MEVAGAASDSQLVLFSVRHPAGKSFAWLVEGGIYVGQLSLEQPSVPQTELGYLEGGRLLPFSAFSSLKGEAPLSMVSWGSLQASFWCF